MAVVLVVLFHLNIPHFSYGFLGVDAFFVISGFLMAILYKSGHVRDFYQRRASRLLPAYFATIVGTLVVSAFVTLPSEHVQVAEQGIFASFFVSNIWFWSQNSYFSKAEFNPLLHLWSLGVEIQFYLIVPLLFWLHSRSKILLVLLALGSMAAAFLLVHISPKTAFFMMPFRIWQFLAGAGVAWYLTRAGATLFPKPWLGLSALVLLVGVSMLYPVDGKSTEAIFGHPGLAAFLVTLATAGVLAFGLPKMLEHSVPGVVLCKLGDWSYSIYLAHFPVIVLALYIPFSGTILTPTGWEQTLLLIMGISVCSAILYMVFDKRRIWSGGFKMTGALMCGVTALAVLSGPVSKLGYDTAQLNILAAFGDRAPYRCGKLIRILNPNAQLCELTGLPETAPALVLVGNSHADSLKASFATVAQEHGYRLFFTVSNAPVVGTPHTAQLLDQFSIIGVEGVIAHFSSGPALYAHDIGFDSDVRAAGFDIVWVLGVPTYESSVPATIWENPEISHAPPRNIADISELEIKLRSADVQVFDPRPVFCPDPDGCRLMDNQMRPFYFDASHLTLTGARELEDMMRDVMNWFEEGR
jgi:peptidoglycan/LPS O-acetylase OafA/YrhL